MENSHKAETTKKGVPNAPHEHTNELIHEKSLYLLQHAHNPVNWRAWNDRAFERARAQDKPVFLSIGYSSCHWCHVMEHDSFENPEVAALLNEHFVPVKVDREERPDIDKVYMDVTQAMTGGGGWPNSIFMTPDKRPFFAGTFFPSDDRYGIKGFKTILAEIANAWSTRRADIEDSANRVVQFLNREAAPQPGGDIPQQYAAHAVTLIGKLFDPRHGGIGMTGPKFPQSHQWTFLLRAWKRSGSQAALDMALKTLDAMARGGLHDQIGGGFHRYSVDEKWLVPHFEKMLYDQALLARSYIEAFQATGDPSHERTARGIFDYVLRDMTGAHGEFFSAEDADSEGEEGKFYVWSIPEVRALLSSDDADLAVDYYGMTPEGNFEGANILHVPVAPAVYAASRGMEQDELQKRLARINAALLQARAARPRPLRDDKVIAAWNGLMISSFAVAAQVLDEPRYAQAAERAARFIFDFMVIDNRLFRSWRDGQAGSPGFLDDYAFLANAMIDLYEATFKPEWLRRAADLARDMIALFHDGEHGAFFYGARDNEQLIKPVKEGMDGAEPSGNSMAALVMARLARFLQRDDYETLARGTVSAFAALIRQVPHAFTQMLQAADFLSTPPQEIVIAGPAGDPLTVDLIRTARAVYNHDRILIHFCREEHGRDLPGIIPWIESKAGNDEQTAAFVCSGFSCKAPVRTPEALASVLRET